MYRHFTRALAALAIIFLSLSPIARATGAPPSDDDCICTPRVNLTGAGAMHHWFSTADASGQVTVTLITPVVGQDAQTVRARVFDAGNNQVGEVSVGYGQNSDPSVVHRGSVIVTGAAGASYRVDVDAPVMVFGARYWMRFDGASDLSIDSGFNNIEGGRATWLVNVDAGDSLGMRIFTQGITGADAQPSVNPYPVRYQWIAPNGDAEAIGSLSVIQPNPPGFIDAVIPPPAALTPGTWRLRLQTLSFAAPGFDYRLEKTTGVDTRLHLEHGSAGRDTGGQIRLVDEHGNPFTGPVDFTFGFGESLTFTITGGLFESTNSGDVFPIPVSITPPAGLVATPAQFDVLPPCDGFFDHTVVIAPPQSPTVAVEASPHALWPPNNKMVTIQASVDASDGSSIELVSITSNEPGGAADITGAMFGTDDRTFQLRAQRLGGGNGRIYTITYRATNAGGSTTATTTVVVPHDQGKK